MSRTEIILAGLAQQNEPATLEGRAGFWCQSDCLFIEAKEAGAAVMLFRDQFAANRVAVSHNHFCGSIMRDKERLARWTPCAKEQPDSDTTVMIANPRWSEPVWMGYLDGDVWRAVDGTLLDDDDGCESEDLLPPTHWMHVPAGPGEP